MAHIYSVKANSQAGNMSQIYNDNTNRPKLKENQPGILGISSREFMHFAGNSAEGLGARREHCWGYISVFENTPKKLLHISPKSCRNFTQWFRERHSSSIVVTVKVGVETTC